ncbi:MAG: hypothetical protein DRQ44_00045 [Gammaproteobacteria bacterium]|nr:MAG: hypothetical protein DRQ44_00045 [Gammaproteobacteria bacterium]
MSTQLIIAGIQATLRAAQAGADLYSEHSRDRQVFLPNLELPPGSKNSQLREFFMENRPLATSQPEFSVLWDKQNEILVDQPPEVFDIAYGMMLKHKAQIQLQNEGVNGVAAEREALMLAGGRMVEQWRAERKPPSAFVRMALTLTDIGLEFVASDPSILGVSSKGEKLVIAFAENMVDLIPDNIADFGAKENFADRLVGIFLRAGLGAISNNASIVISNDDVAKLLKGVTRPIVDALPDNLVDQINYRNLVDTLAGPSAEAALIILAEKAENNLGQKLASDTALAAVTSAMFEEIKATTAEGTIIDVFGEQGMISLYQAGLGVAVDRPELFLTGDDTPNSELFKDILKGAATTLRKYPRFEGPVGASLSAMVVDVVGEKAPTLLKLDPDEAWGKVAISLIDQITSNLHTALTNLDANGNPKGSISVFNDEQLLEIGRTILTQVAKTPGMIGTDRTEVQDIVAGMAAAMASDDNLLLSADEWIVITGVAAHNAAANPERLFGISSNEPEGALAVQVIKSILGVAGEKWISKGRSAGVLLFGETLETIIVTSLDALAGDIAAVKQNPALAGSFLNQLLIVALAQPEKLGSESLIKVFESFINKVLATGELPNEDQIIASII